MQDPPKGTHKEFASTMKVSSSKVLKGKAIKHSITGIGRPTSTKAKLPQVPKTSPSIAWIDAEGHTTLTKSPLHIPAVPVLWLLPPVTRVSNAMPPVDNVVRPGLLTGPPDNENAFSAISGNEAATACTGLVNKPLSSHTGTPKTLSRPSSALAMEHPRSVPMTCPPSHAATPLMHNASVTGKEGPAALMKLMSQPRQLESATTSPELLLGPSQEDISQLEQTNENFQSSGSSQTHGMTLKYSNEDEVTDEEMRELDLQAATHQYMMQQDAQNSTTPSPFQDPQAPSQPTEEEDKYIPDGQNTRLSQVAQKQLAYLPDGSPGFRMQIMYLQQFFGTNWFLVHKDTFELFTIYDAVFIKTTYCAQSQPFNLVTLDTDLQEYLQNWMSCINMKKE